MRTIYFFTSPSCAACEEWKPTIDDFIKRNLGKIIVIRCNPNLREYTFGKWRVRYTPSAAVTEGGALLRKAEGLLMSLDELGSFAFDEVTAEREEEPEEDEDEEE